MKFNKKTLWIVGAAFLAIAAAVMILTGSSYTLKKEVNDVSLGEEQYRVTLEQDHEIVRVTGQRLEDGVLSVDVRAVSRGKAVVILTDPSGDFYYETVYVHLFGVITVDSFFGVSSGTAILPVLIALYILLLICYLAAQYRSGVRRNLYRYRNIRNMGWIVFLTLTLAGQISGLFNGAGIADAVSGTLHSASNVAFIAFPAAFVVSILVAVSNFRLMRREGRSWRNMLGLLLGLFVCLSTVFPYALGEWLQRTTVVDVHNMGGPGMYIEMAVTNTILVAVSYLECILLGTIILTVKAARRIPAFDKDYILILGCKIRGDGSLTPLLKGRADRALDFARMQKEAGGRDVVFVPSGGQGGDEIMPEAQAVKNYLLEQGVPGERIIAEDGSANTYENFKNSLALIRKDCGGTDPKIAFSTTNYHVFRSGVLAERQGASVEGIGSKTRSYFWINAFVREFIATLAAEWKRHLAVIAALVLTVIAMVAVVMLSNNL